MPTRPATKRDRGNDEEMADISERESHRAKRPFTPPSQAELASASHKNASIANPALTHKTPAPSQALSPPSPEASKEYTLLKQPETKPITEDQLVQEVKGIYAGLGELFWISTRYVGGMTD